MESRSRSRQKHDTVQNILSLPQHLIHLILIPWTSTKEKKTLRGTCKTFKKALDDSLVHVQLQLQHDRDRQHMEDCLRRMQQWHGLKSMSLTSTCLMGGLLQHMPDHLTTLSVSAHNYQMGSIYGIRVHIDLKVLKRLKCLGSLALHIDGQFTGLEDISGLTSLYVAGCNRSNGSVAHLAPTLRHLRLRHYSDVSDINHLTNLKELQIQHNMPLEFFATHGHLPLKHVHMHQDYCDQFLASPKAWESAPTTLTSLTLQASNYDIRPGTLPPHITHLQLPRMWQVNLEQIGAACTKLTSLELGLEEWQLHNIVNVLFHSSRFPNLRYLSMYVFNIYTFPVGLDRQQVLSAAAPELTSLTARGVMFDVKPEFDTVWDIVNSCPRELKSAWASHA